MTFAVALPSKNTSFLQNMVYMHVVEINLHKTLIVQLLQHMLSIFKSVKYHQVGYNTAYNSIFSQVILLGNSYYILW